MNSKKAYELEHGAENNAMKEILQEAYTEKFKRTKYIFVLDFNDGKVYRYNVRALCNEENEWNPDHESCEAFLFWLFGIGNSLNSGGITNGDFFSTKNSSLLFFLGFLNPFLIVLQELKTNIIKNKKKNILNFFISNFFRFINNF